MQEPSVESQYVTVMDSIAYRLAASHQALSAIEASPEDSANWIHLDTVALQVRKVCELLILSSTLAHLQEGTELDPRKWRPKQAFTEINKFNLYPLPLPLEPEIRVLLDGSKQFVPASRPMPFSVLSTIYGMCGHILHVPSASKVLDESITPFDVAQFKRWIAGFCQLIGGHILLLPDLGRIIVCRWSVEDKSNRICLLAEGNGDAFLDDKSLPEFRLIRV